MISEDCYKTRFVHQLGEAALLLESTDELNNSVKEAAGRLAMAEEIASQEAFKSASLRLALQNIVTLIEHSSHDHDETLPQLVTAKRLLGQ